MKQKISHLFKSHLCGLLIWITIILGTATCLCFCFEQFQSHISCVIGIISLAFSAWVAYQAITIRQHVLNKSTLKIIDNLYDEWKPPFGNAMEILDDAKRDEAIQIYDYILKASKYLPQEIADSITLAKNQLEQDKEKKRQTYTKTFTRQLNSIYDTWHNL